MRICPDNGNENFETRKQNGSDGLKENNSEEVWRDRGMEKRDGPGHRDAQGEGMRGGGKREGGTTKGGPALYTQGEV